MSNPGYTPKRMTGYTDTDLLNALEERVNEGGCPALIFDDDGHWAVSESGIQNCIMKTPSDLEVSYFIKKKYWKRSIREALVNWIERRKR